jgi:hypothetical protein
VKRLKHFAWFMRESKSFLDCGYFSLIIKGGLYKAIKHANYMVKYEKLTSEQREYLYLTEDRTINFD